MRLYSAAPMVARAVNSTALTVHTRAVYKSTREALNQVAALFPGRSLVLVTKPTVCSILVNTPILDSTNQTIATATNTTTQATSESRKLNFMTDSGSIRCRLRSALRGAGPTCPAHAPPGCCRPGCALGGAPAPGPAG